MKMNKLQREMTAFQMWESGKKYKEIGEYFGVCRNRAHQMARAHIKREEKIDKADPLTRDLLCMDCEVERVFNVLRHSRNYAGDVEEIAKVGAKELLKMKNFGRKSLGKVAGALERIGIIKNAQEWIKST